MTIDKFALRKAALDVLKRFGPLNHYKVAEQLDESNDRKIYLSLKRATVATAATPQEAHVSKWERNDEPGARRAHWIAVFAFGPGRNKKKPAATMTAKEKNARYYQRNKGVIAIRVATRYHRTNKKADPFAVFVLTQLGNKPK